MYFEPGNVPPASDAVSRAWNEADYVECPGWDLGAKVVSPPGEWSADCNGGPDWIAWLPSGLPPTLADLYDANAMPAELRKAHRKLDEAVDGLYKRGGFESDRERVEHLFAFYEKLVAPLTAAAGKPHKRAKAKPSLKPR